VFAGPAGCIVACGMIVVKMGWEEFGRGSRGQFGAAARNVAD